MKFKISTLLLFGLLLLTSCGGDNGEKKLLEQLSSSYEYDEKVVELEGYMGMPVLLVAGDSYQVKVRYQLDVYSSPSRQSEKIGELQNNQYIDVYSIENGWAKMSFNGQRAYVVSQYITPSVNLGGVSLHTVLICLVLLISIFFAYIGMSYNWDGDIEGWRLTLAGILFVVLFGVELLYINVLDGEFWFCDEEKIGGLWAIFNFILLALYLGITRCAFVMTLRSLGSDSRDSDDDYYELCFGLLAVALIVLGICKWIIPSYVDWAYIAIAIIVIGQSLILLKLVEWKSFKEVMLYLFGIISSITLLIFVFSTVPFVAIFPGALVLIFIASLFNREVSAPMAPSKPRSKFDTCYSCRSYYNGECTRYSNAIKVSEYHCCDHYEY